MEDGNEPGYTLSHGLRISRIVAGLFEQVEALQPLVDLGAAGRY